MFNIKKYLFLVFVLFTFEVNATSVTLTGAGTGAGFNPSLISNLSFWFDASQSNTVTLNGLDVASIADLSGNGHNATQGTSGQQPLYGLADINGKNTIVFTGANNDILNLTSATAITKNISGFSCFGVIKPGSVAATNDFIRFLGGTGNNRFIVSIAATNGRLLSSTRRLDGDTTNNATNASIAFTVGQASSFVTSIDYVTGAGRLRIGATSGDFTASWTAGGNTSDTVSSVAPSLGRATTNTFTGSIGEVSCWVKVLTLTEENNLIDYATSKWNTP